MSKVSTKAVAEAALRELPAVLGAFVREDVYGHPREVHLLVAPGPNPRDFARDVRDLLQQRLGIEVDQRVISIAQLSKDLDPLPPDPVLSDSGGDAPASTAPPRQDPGSPDSPAPETAEQTAVPRVIYEGIESRVREGMVEVTVRLSWRSKEFLGSSTELDGGAGRIRAAALATLRAAAATISEKVILDLETASVTRALGREYVLISVLASAPVLGRRPLTLIGAQPLEFDAETTAALATLQAVNRILSRMLES